jgi:hypothetical protein
MLTNQQNADTMNLLSVQAQGLRQHHAVAFVQSGRLFNLVFTQRSKS